MSPIETLKSVLVPIHREGYPFIALAGIIMAVLFLVSNALGFIGLIITLWCIYFFRDPDRVSPDRPGLVLSPADGVLQSIQQVVPPKELEMGDAPLTRIAIFMNVFDVHVNRSPVAGRITAMHYYAGSFVNASLDKASEENERKALRITVKDGREIAVVQIAGLIARRIVSFVKKDDELRAGERFGLIRFGSRVDVYLPEGVHPLVIVGQRTIAGETVIADLESGEPARTGKVL